MPNSCPPQKFHNDSIFIATVFLSSRRVSTTAPVETSFFLEQKKTNHNFVEKLL